MLPPYLSLPLDLLSRDFRGLSCYCFPPLVTRRWKFLFLPDSIKRNFRAESWWKGNAMETTRLLVSLSLKPLNFKARQWHPSLSLSSMGYSKEFPGYLSLRILTQLSKPNWVLKAWRILGELLISPVWGSHYWTIWTTFCKPAWQISS